MAPHPPFGHLLPARGEKDLIFESPRPAKRGEGGAKRRVRGDDSRYEARACERAARVVAARRISSPRAARNRQRADARRAISRRPFEPHLPATIRQSRARV